VALSIVLLVLFTICMFAWALEAFGAGASRGRVLAWVAVLILGVVVFLAGFGVLTYRPGP
jgi:heme A synthase